MSSVSDIKSLIRSIAKSTDTYAAFLFEASVVSASDNACTIQYHGMQFPDVRLVAGMSNSTATMIAKPAQGSAVLVADLSAGKFRDMVVILVEKNESISFNGGKNGGLVNISDLTGRLNAIEDDLNTLKKALNTWVPMPQDGGAALKTAAEKWIASPLAKTTASDIEDPLVKH